MAREETRCRHMGYISDWQLGVFYMHHPTDRIAHTTVFVTPVVEQWLEREIAQRIEPTTHRTISERSYHGATSRSNHNYTETRRKRRY